MITVRIKGGLGNQLFQYAAAYALSQRLGQEIQLDASFFPHQNLRGYKLDKLKIVHCSTSSRMPILVETVKNRYVNKLLRTMHITFPLKKPLYLLQSNTTPTKEFLSISAKEVYLDGYYQSELYFKECREALCRQFVPAYEQEVEYHNALQAIQNTNSVAVHVRRGDFLNFQNKSNTFYYVLSTQYYHNAISYIEKGVDAPVFFWFSDDIEWVKENFGESSNFVFVTMHTKNPDIDELMLMKNCKHIITANSTFSWWASWLNQHEDSIHICPAKRYGNSQMIPESWIKIAVD